MIEDYRPLVDDLTSVGQELIDTYTHDDGQIVGNEVTDVTTKYDQVKRDAREKLHLLNEALQPTITDVSVYLHVQSNLHLRCVIVVGLLAVKGVYL